MYNVSYILKNDSRDDKITLMNEQALIADAQNGSLDAFNTLVLHYQDSVFNTALRILAHPW